MKLIQLQFLNNLSERNACRRFQRNQPGDYRPDENKTSLSNNMEAQMQEPETMETKSPEAATMPEINSQAGTITKIQAPQSQEQFQKYLDQVSTFLSGLPEYAGSIFNKYKQPLVIIGLIVGAIVTLKVVLAILDALNDIPLVAPTFELIGIGYSAWFVYRYLLKANTRNELTSEIQTLKSQVVGKS